MRVPAWLRVGAATHTGLVRRNNEDDYLLGTVGEGDAAVFLAAIADGVGGAPGGAEASRAALRGLGAVVLDGGAAAPAEQRLRDGYRAAGERLHEQALMAPFLRDMGTTLTAVVVTAARLHVGHVGDTRLYRWHHGRLARCTEDHAAREPDNVLLRWIGGGRRGVEADFAAFDLVPGERWLLLSDGVWSVLPAVELARLTGRGEPGQVAAALVARALDLGGPDNATAVVLEVGDAGADGAARDVELPGGETPSHRDRWPRAPSLSPPRWPWLLLGAAVLLGAELLLRRFAGLDIWAALRSLFG